MPGIAHLWWRDLFHLGESLIYRLCFLHRGAGLGKPALKIRICLPWKGWIYTFHRLGAKDAMLSFISSCQLCLRIDISERTRNEARIWSLLVNDCIYLDLDSPLATPLSYLENSRNMVSFARLVRSSDEDICFRIKTIAGNCHHVEVLAVSVKPFLCDLRPVVHNRAGLEFEFFLAKAEYLTNKGRFQERFSTANIEFLHPCLCEHTETSLSFLQWQNREIRWRMKAKLAAVIALSFKNTSAHVRTGNSGAVVHLSVVESGHTYEENNSQKWGFFSPP